MASWHTYKMLFHCNIPNIFFPSTWLVESQGLARSNQLPSSSSSAMNNRALSTKKNFPISPYLTINNSAVWLKALKGVHWACPQSCHISNAPNSQAFCVSSCVKSSATQRQHYWKIRMRISFAYLRQFRGFKSPCVSSWLNPSKCYFLA